MNTTTTYKIGDHPNKAAVIDKHRDINVDMFEWWDCAYDDWKEKLTALGYDNPEIQFSGFWSQGDGASFTASQVPLPSTDTSVQKAWAELEGAAALLGVTVTEDIADLAYGKVYRHGHHYVHENTVSVDWEWNDPPFSNWKWDWATDGVPDGLEHFIESLKTAVESYFKDLDETVTDLCCQIYSDLEKEYEYLTSDEAVEETLEANEYEFDEEGEIV